MPRVVLPIANGFYQSDSLPLSAQECINWYPHAVQSAGLSSEALFSTPGIEQLASSGSAGTEANRGAHRMGDSAYFINGRRLYRMNSDFSLNNLGTVEGSGRVSIADNGTQMMILATGLEGSPSCKGYIFSATGGDYLGEIVDEGFYENGNPQHVVFIDGYFLCSTDTKKFIISAINDGESWNSLDVGTAEADPDPISVPAVLNNQLFLFGSESIEAFANTALGADFPFQRTGTFTDKGTDAPYSLVRAQSRLFFVGRADRESPAVWAYAGSGEPEKVSTEPIESILQRLTSEQVASIFAWSYAQKGAYFVGFSLPHTCIVFDLVSGRWHERKSRVTFQDNSVVLTRYRVNSIVQAYNKLIVGDFIDGRIGSLDIDIYTEYGGNIIRRAAGQPFQNNMQSFFIPMLELSMESGTGNASEEDPLVEMQRSLDGKTWTDFRQRSIGKIGEYAKRQIWYKLGRASRFESFAFETSAKCKAVIIQATAEVLAGRK